MNHVSVPVCGPAVGDPWLTRQGLQRADEGGDGRRESPHLQRRGNGGALGLGAIKALNVAVADLDLEVFRHAGVAVNVLALLEAQAAGAQLLREADGAAEHGAVENPLALRLVKVQQLR